jgi:RimJ/RimL family protein N-acetyltransferase
MNAAIVASIEELKPWMPWAVEPVLLEAQAAFIESETEAWATGTTMNYGIFAADGAFLGGVGMHDRNGPGALEIGYWLDTRHSGKGVMTRVVEALGARLFELPGIERIEIHCDAANAPSAAVPKRLGYRLDRYVERANEAPGETGRHMIWILDRPAAG